jgi:hypothetical protein
MMVVWRDCVVEVSKGPGDVAGMTGGALWI